jgi:hypothetical protein
MGINKEFFAPTEAVLWNGVEACTLRGITPDDLARVMVENAAEVEELFTLMERDDTLKGISMDDPQAAMKAMQANGAQFFALLVNKVPVLVAKIIAVAADDPGEWEHVRKNFVLPLQFECLQIAAKLTFVDSNGFKTFLGNVLALVGKASGDQRAKTIEHQTDSPGSES